jgi:hypothetical protein
MSSMPFTGQSVFHAGPLACCIPESGLATIACAALSELQATVPGRILIYTGVREAECALVFLVRTIYHGQVCSLRVMV